MTDSSLKGAKRFLDILTELVPPGENQRHNITVEDDKLTLTLMVGSKYYSYHFDENDLVIDVDSLASGLRVPL